MSKTPFMQLWVNDFIGKTLDLTDAEIGQYMLLLMAAWNGKGYLPSDEKKLKQIARAGRNWAHTWPTLQRYFETDGERVWNETLLEQYANAVAKREVNAHNGALGGRAKALKTNEPDLANASVSPKQSESESYREEREEDSYESSCDLLASPQHVNDVAEAVSAYNDAAHSAGWPQVQKVTPARRNALKARLRDASGLDGWRHAIRQAEKSDFLCGRTSKPWTGFGFDWLTKQANFTKIMEGNYDNRTNHSQQSSDRSGNRADPALANIARIVGLGQASGNGGF